jgi:translation initiation factor 1A
VARAALGGSRFSVLCDDGLTRMMRMPGKFKKRMWVRVNDLIIIKPWVVQSDKKCDLVYRFLPPERRWVYNNKRVKKHLVI